jgi:phospholipid-binding lipoprotein MlaA
MDMNMLIPPEPAAVISAQPTPPVGDPADPLEGANRKIYALNEGLDRTILRPVAITYRRILPRPIRSAVHNAIGNWDEPVVFVNDVLQLRLGDAAQTAGRFALNTTVGVVGVFDVATGAGLPHHDNGFTLTMGRYGVKSGPYLYLPILGPSSTRDIVGSGVDLFTNPLTAIRHIRSRRVELAQNVASAVDARASLEGDLQTVDATATDPYAFVRSVYRQHIEAQIAGDEISLDPIPDLAPLPSAPKP